MKILDARRVATAVDPSGFPREGVAEIAFLGRSNAGKSSLLNALAGRRALARVAAAPGKTRAIHFYRIEREAGARRVPPVLFVDLPGYGFARVSKAERAAWQRLVEGYLEGRSPLAGAVLVQDLRRDASDDERDLLTWLHARGVPVLVALTKSDKLGRGARAARERKVAADYGLPAGRIVPTSAPAREGRAELWKAIDGLLEASA
jgi:GTP-binding protein